MKHTNSDLVKPALRLADWVLYTSLFTALCAVSLCIATEQLLAIPLRPLLSHLHLLLLGSTLVVYNAPRVFRAPFPHENNIAGWWRNYRVWYIIFLCLGAAATGNGLVGLPLSALLTCALLALFAFAYSLPLIPFIAGHRLRDYGWLKIIILSTVWTVATSILPIIYNGRPLLHYPFEILQRFTFIFALCILFDIRDTKEDLSHGVYTLPARLGMHRAYALINIALLLFIIISAIQYLHYPMPARLAGAILTAILTRLVAGYLHKHPSHRGYMLLADGVMLIYAALVVL